MNFADIERQLQEMESDSKVKAAMTEERIQIHHALGITDEREKEIGKEVFEIVTDAGRVDVAGKRLADKYDGEALLVGMRLMQAIQVNERLDQHKQELDAATAGGKLRSLKQAQNAPQN